MRRVLASGAFGLVAVMAVLAPARVGAVTTTAGKEVAPAAQSDWKQEHFDPGHSGSNPYEHILSPANVATPTETFHREASPDTLDVSRTFSKGFQPDTFLMAGRARSPEPNIKAINAQHVLHEAATDLADRLLVALRGK
jgi:hypothetical protein